MLPFSLTSGLPRIFWTVAIASALTGCGLAQTIADGTTKAARWAFTTEVATLNLDVADLGATEAADTMPTTPTIVRIYQLERPENFKSTGHGALFMKDRDVLGTDLLSLHDVVLRPGGSASVSVPMSPKTKDVGVAAFRPGAGHLAASTLLIPLRQWAETDPVHVSLIDGALTLAPASH